ncbi:hypothetical protein MWU52_06045 [Jannaschia sp. S6380]|uniref:Flp family type IVb pilin n=1 Tax=Jannaschia sp. S6380 TaxID=2926408 RepID=UPI001FF4AF1A|nr:hypothetical protein [Jannaschia sp. S6380]MCK0167106.1 hypothetical protein [Jannaschia sp. S6380]
MIREFLAAEDGASTVEWSLMTALVVALMLVVTNFVLNGTAKQTADIRDQLLSEDLMCTDFCDHGLSDE